jgi:hypothetical protein
MTSGQQLTTAGSTVTSRSSDYGSTVKIAVVEMTPYFRRANHSVACTATRRNSPSTSCGGCSGYLVDVVDRVSRILPGQQQQQVEWSVERSEGKRRRDGSWSGLLGRVASWSVDVGLVAINPQQLQQHQHQPQHNDNGSPQDLLTFSTVPVLETRLSFLVGPSLAARLPSRDPRNSDRPRFVDVVDLVSATGVTLGVVANSRIEQLLRRSADPVLRQIWKRMAIPTDSDDDGRLSRTGRTLPPSQFHIDADEGRRTPDTADWPSTSSGTTGGSRVASVDEGLERVLHDDDFVLMLESTESSLLLTGSSSRPEFRSLTAVVDEARDVVRYHFVMPLRTGALEGGGSGQTSSLWTASRIDAALTQLREDGTLDELYRKWWATAVDNNGDDDVNRCNNGTSTAAAAAAIATPTATTTAATVVPAAASRLDVHRSVVDDLYQSWSPPDADRSGGTDDWELDDDSTLSRTMDWESLAMERIFLESPLKSTTSARPPMTSSVRPPSLLTSTVAIVQQVRGHARSPHTVQVASSSVTDDRVRVTLGTLEADDDDVMVDLDDDQSTTSRTMPTGMSRSAAAEPTELMAVPASSSAPVPPGLTTSPGSHRLTTVKKKMNRNSRRPTLSTTPPPNHRRHQHHHGRATTTATISAADDMMMTSSSFSDSKDSQELHQHSPAVDVVGQFDQYVGVRPTSGLAATDDLTHFRRQRGSTTTRTLTSRPVSPRQSHILPDDEEINAYLVTHRPRYNNNNNNDDGDDVVIYPDTDIVDEEDVKEGRGEDEEDGVVGDWQYHGDRMTEQEMAVKEHWRSGDRSRDKAPVERRQPPSPHGDKEPPQGGETVLDVSSSSTTVRPPPDSDAAMMTAAAAGVLYPRMTLRCQLLQTVSISLGLIICLRSIDSF